MDYSQSVNYLYGLGHEILSAKFRLENIQILLEALGNPQKKYRSVLVAGTNGKGSVSAMVESVVRTAGHRTALYTSPHLITIEERMKVCGEEISQADFAKFASVIRRTSERLVAEKRLVTVPTFFEQVTAIALTYFREQKIDLAVLEVGLGGRLDATNAVERIGAVVTAIDYDHQEILGNSIAEIAAEKAAIIQQNAFAVLGKQRFKEAEAVLTQRCKEVKITPVHTYAGSEVKLVHFGLPQFVYRSHQKNEYAVKLGLRGRHQVDNAATAIETCEAISHAGFAISREAIIEGVEKTIWNGRLEWMEGTPKILFDGAHNRSGAQVLKEFLQEIWQGDLTLVFAVMNDKDIAGMAAELFPLFDKIIFTKADEMRGASEAKLREFVNGRATDVQFVGDVEQAIAKARKITAADGLIVVAGSLYLVGKAKKLLQ
jgi:dihydrofolate synthase/folylpolyglutamate synthase